MKKVLKQLFNNAVKLNHQHILELLEKNSDAKLLDLGCDDGAVSIRLAKKIGTKNIYGVDNNQLALKKARNLGITTTAFDLNGTFKFKSSTFDVIHSNQVIEHLCNSDMFISEIFRILKPGGYAIISTENASSWVNVVASALGWQIFSLTNFSNMQESIGNPLSLHQGKQQGHSSWNHVRIYSLRALIEYFELFGFIVETKLGAGYFPLPAVLGRYDPTHAHFITIKARKPK